MFYLAYYMQNIIISMCIPYKILRYFTLFENTKSSLSVYFILLALLNSD